MKQKKLNLEVVKIKSFVTEIEPKLSDKMKGGTTAVATPITCDIGHPTEPKQ